MTIEVKIPLLAESVAEATLMEWRKQPGDPVKFGDALIDVETDKVTLEVVAPQDGVLVKILKNGGEDVVSNEVIAEIDTDETARATTPEPDPAVTATPPAAPAVAPDAGQQQQEQTRDHAAAAESATQTAADRQQAAPAEKTRPRLSPAVRNLLTEHGLEASDIPTKGGRLTKKQVLDYLEQQRASAAAAKTETPGGARKDVPTLSAADIAIWKNRRNKKDVPDDLSVKRPEPETAKTAEAGATTAAATPPPPARASSPATATEQRAGDRRVPMTRLRRRAAERLLQAQQENAILTTFNEVNMQPIMELRKRYKDSFEETHKVKLGFMSFFTKAAVEALKKFPIINASVAGDDIIYHDCFDIGIAVSSPRGLVVPVVRAADQLSLADIEKTISAYGQKAHDAKLTLEELSGGTFTITNGGVFGSLLSTPIINPPQSAILGMHKIQQRPVAENGAVVVRPMMYLALSYDHRIIDGREAVSFLVALKEALEDPARLLLQI